MRATEINQDGRSNGLIAPNPKAQQSLLAGAYARAGLSPDALSFIEAHGSGTELGDAIELESLATALGRRRSRPLLVGSVKSNVGHLESAAGLAGILKTTLALHHRRLPPSIHFRRGNAQVDWKTLGLEVPVGPVELGAGALVAGVSSFGFGGTNVHAILESAPDLPPPAAADVNAGGPPVILLSGKTERAAARRAEELAGFLRANPSTPLADLGRELAFGRQHFAWRLAVPCGSEGEVVQALASARPRHARAGASVGVWFGDPRKIAMDAPPASPEIDALMPAALRGADPADPRVRTTRVLLGQLVAARALARAPVAWSVIAGSGVGLVAAATASGHLPWVRGTRRRSICCSTRRAGSWSPAARSSCATAPIGCSRRRR